MQRQAFSFRIYTYLKALKKNDTIHMYLIGVRPDYQGRGALALVYNELQKAYLKIRNYQGHNTTSTGK
jgi:ribosomal protein S18 acetylase RimI-like enzyme